MHEFFQLCWCNVHLEIAAEKQKQPTRIFLYGIINLRKQFACVKRKAAAQAKYLGRSSGTGEGEFCLKSTEVNESCRLGTWNAPENGMENSAIKIKFKAALFAIDATHNRGRLVNIYTALQTIDRMLL
ncbi:hypothetical protein TNCV_5117191 [Trichonephila clavipes]|nr:hypothetical protein TNCV_5117191 [Trichonephila clavipes]